MSAQVARPMFMRAGDALGAGPFAPLALGADALLFAEERAPDGDLCPSALPSATSSRPSGMSGGRRS